MQCKLAISNIAWTQPEDEAVYSLMQKYGFQGLEIAPSRIWESPYTQTDSAVQAFNALIKGKGLSIVAFQSLLFGRPELSIFHDNKLRLDTLNHLKKNICLAHKLGASALVFGSPKNRVIGNTEPVLAKKIALDFFQELGEYAGDKSTCFCLEPNPKIYETDFLCTTKEALDFVRTVDTPGLKINIDLGTIIANNEDIESTMEKALPYAGHLHISEPFLKKIEFNETRHKKIKQLIDMFGYKKTISIEMKVSDKQETRLATIEATLDFVSRIYGK